MQSFDQLKHNAKNLDAPTLSELEQAALIQSPEQTEKNILFGSKVVPTIKKPEFKEFWVFQGYIGGKFGPRSRYRVTFGAITNILLSLTFLLLYFLNLLLKKKVDWLLINWILFIDCIATIPDYYFLVIQKPRENYVADIIPLLIKTIWIAFLYIGPKMGVNWVFVLGFIFAAFSLLLVLIRANLLERSNQVFLFLFLARVR